MLPPTRASGGNSIAAVWEQVVDPIALGAALQMDDGDRGLDPGHPSLELRHATHPFLDRPLPFHCLSLTVHSFSPPNVFSLPSGITTASGHKSSTAPHLAARPAWPGAAGIRCQHHALLSWCVRVCVCRSMGCTASTLTACCAAARSGLHRYYQPYLSGYGGVRTSLLGNGAVYTYVSDNGEASMTEEVRESLGFGPLC